MYVCVCVCVCEGGGGAGARCTPTGGSDQKSIFAYCDFLMIHSFTYSGTFCLLPVLVNMLVIRAGDLHIKLYMQLLSSGLCLL